MIRRRLRWAPLALLCLLGSAAAQAQEPPGAAPPALPSGPPPGAAPAEDGPGLGFVAGLRWEPAGLSFLVAGQPFIDEAQPILAQPLTTLLVGLELGPYFSLHGGLAYMGLDLRTTRDDGIDRDEHRIGFGLWLPQLLVRLNLWRPQPGAACPYLQLRGFTALVSLSEEDDGGAAEGSDEALSDLEDAVDFAGGDLALGLRYDLNRSLSLSLESGLRWMANEARSTRLRTVSLEDGNDEQRSTEYSSERNLFSTFVVLGFDIRL